MKSKGKLFTIKTEFGTKTFDNSKDALEYADEINEIRKILRDVGKGKSDDQ